MKIRLLLLSFILSFLFTSCDYFKEGVTYKLKAGEILCNADVNCIKESCYDGVYFIGLENGSIIRKDIINDVSDTINIGYQRIYDIVEKMVNDSVSCLWIGEKDHGLRKVTFNRFTKQTVEELNPSIREKGTHYSVYSVILMDGDSIVYVGTSNGYYSFIPSRMDSLNLISIEITNKICLLDNILYLATNKGVFFYDIKRGMVTDSLRTKFINHQPVTNLRIVKRKINIIQGGKLIQYDIDSKKDSVLYPYQVPFYQKIFNHPNYWAKASIQEEGTSLPRIVDYLVDNKGNQWYYTTTMVMFKKKDGNTTLPLPVKVNVKLRPNMLLTKDEFLFLPDQDKILQIPMNETTTGEQKNVIGIARSDSEDRKVYFVLTRDNCLYKYTYKESEKKNEASFLNHINKIDDEIVQIKSSRHFLWYASQKKLYRTDKNGKHLQVIYDCTDYPIREEIHDLLVDNEDRYLYLGLRNCLRCFSEKEIKGNNICEGEMLKVDDDSFNHHDLYVTSLLLSNSKSLIVGTLNKGLFYKRENKDDFEPVPFSECDSIGSILSVINLKNEYAKIGEDSRLQVHTTKGFYLFDETHIDQRPLICTPFLQSTKTIKAIIEKSDYSFYGIGQKGICCYPAPKYFSFKDMIFNKTTFEICGDKILCGGRHGLYLVTLGQSDAEDGLEPVLLKGSLDPYKILNVLFPAVLLLMLFLFGRNMRKDQERKKNEEIQEIKLERDELQKEKNTNKEELTRLEQETMDLQTRLDQTKKERDDFEVENLNIKKQLQDLQNRSVPEFNTLKNSIVELIGQNLKSTKDFEEIRKKLRSFYNKFIQQPYPELRMWARSDEKQLFIALISLGKHYSAGTVSSLDLGIAANTVYTWRSKLKDCINEKLNLDQKNTELIKTLLEYLNMDN